MPIESQPSLQGLGVGWSGAWGVAGMLTFHQLVRPQHLCVPAPAPQSSWKTEVPDTLL